MSANAAKRPSPNVELESHPKRNRGADPGKVMTLPSGSQNGDAKAVLSTPGSSPPKVASIFQAPSKLGKLTWLESIDLTYLHGVYGEPQPSTKVAAFDLDGNLIKPRSGNKFPKDETDWMFWHPSAVVRGLRAAHEAGFAIVLFTNQLEYHRGKSTTMFKNKMPYFAQALGGIPFRVFAALARDKYRKPMTGMWDVFVDRFNGGIRPDLAQSYYVGDAAGRRALGKTPKDHNDTDRKFAVNVGMPFFTPEEYFLKHAPRDDWAYKGYDARAHDHDLPAWHPSTSPIAYDSPLTSSDPSARLEVVLFVGSPGIGKTTFYKTHFAPRGYAHVNQDTLKSRERCLAAVKFNLESGKSCVVDNTNRDVATRVLYVNLAAQLDVPIRCVHFRGTADLAKHNSLYRAHFGRATDEKRDVLPDTAIHGYASAFEPPTVGEGFEEVKVAEFVFEGTPEEKARWSRWLS